MGKSIPSAGNKLRKCSQVVTQKRQNIKIYQPMANGRRQTQQRQESSHHSAKPQRGLDLENGACPLCMLNSLPRNHTQIPTLISSSSDWKSRVGPCLPFPAGSCPPETGLVITFLSEASGGLHKIVFERTRDTVGAQQTPGLSPRPGDYPVPPDWPELCCEEGWGEDPREYYAPKGAVRERRCRNNHIVALFSV